MEMNKKILKEVSDCKNIRELVLVLENLIRTKKLSRNLTVMIMNKAKLL